MGRLVIPGTGPAVERRAYLAIPVPTSTAPGPWPGVVVVHEGPGPSIDMHEQCDWFAAAGYLAVMPDLYHGKSMLRCVRGVVRQLVAQRGPAFEQLGSARAWLAGRADCTGAVGVVGYCMGGGFALILAARPGYTAAAVNYSPLPENLDEVLGGACPMVASFGAKDPTLEGAADKVRAALDRSGVPNDVKEYPNAGHTFISRMSAPWPLPAIAKIAGFGYDHDSAADAKRRMLAWFDVHLRSATTETTGEPAGA